MSWGVPGNLSANHMVKRITQAAQTFGKIIHTLGPTIHPTLLKLAGLTQILLERIGDAAAGQGFLVTPGILQVKIIEPTIKLVFVERRRERPAVSLGMHHVALH